MKNIIKALSAIVLHHPANADYSNVVAEFAPGIEPILSVTDAKLWLSIVAPAVQTTPVTRYSAREQHLQECLLQSGRTIDSAPAASLDCPQLSRPDLAEKPLWEIFVSAGELASACGALRAAVTKPTPWKGRYDGSFEQVCFFRSKDGDNRGLNLVACNNAKSLREIPLHFRAPDAAPEAENLTYLLPQRAVVWLSRFATLAGKDDTLKIRLYDNVWVIDCSTWRLAVLRPEIGLCYPPYREVVSAVRVTKDCALFFECASMIKILTMAKGYENIRFAAGDACFLLNGRAGLPEHFEIQHVNTHGLGTGDSVTFKVGVLLAFLKSLPKKWDENLCLQGKLGDAFFVSNSCVKGSAVIMCCNR